MSDDQDGCEWASVFSGTGLPRLSRTKAVKRLCVCVCLSVCLCVGDVKIAGREWRAQSPLPRRSRCAFYRAHTSSATTDVLTTCHPPAARRRAARGSDYFRLSPEIDFGSVLPPTYY